MNQETQRKPGGEANSLKDLLINSDSLKVIYNSADNLKKLLERIDKFAEELNLSRCENYAESGNSTIN
jgi:coenzyme F420-reducing hydrogenase delta subunit